MLLGLLLLLLVCIVCYAKLVLLFSLSSGVAGELDLT